MQNCRTGLRSTKGRHIRTASRNTVNYKIPKRPLKHIAEVKLSNLRINGKEKTLKEVLKNLHEEFSMLNG